MTFATYLNNLESNVPWIGTLPDHWNIGRVKQIFCINKRIAGALGHDILSITQSGIRIKDTESNDGQISMDYSKYQLVYPGDFAMNHMDLLTGWIDISNIKGVTSPDYRVFSIRDRANIDPRYFLYIFQMGYEQKIFYPLGQGSSQLGRWRLPSDAFNEFILPIPPLNEQAAIAAFLDSETAKINILVKEQRHLIRLLKEKRQSVISHAITKGLNPNAPMKDSCVEWLGKVPTHWIVTNAGRYLRILSGFAFPSEGFSTNSAHTRLLRGVNVGVGRVRWDETVFWSRSPNDGLSAFELSEGELVIGMDRPWISEGVRIAKLSQADTPCLLLQRVASLRPDKCLDVDYLQLLLSNSAFVDFFTPDMTGVSVPHLSPSQISAFPVPLPPVDEQRAIVAYVQTKALEADRLIASAEEVITLLVERRSALIFAAVTGKFDVRGATKVKPFTVGRVRARGLIAAEIIERLAHQATFGRVKLQKVAYLAEAHAGVIELEGAYLREAAGPLDREMISDMEREAEAIAGVRIKQPDGPGSAVAYRIGDRHGVHRHDLVALLGDRAAIFDKLVRDIGTIDTKGAEAVATLYAVWNDALSEGEPLTDNEIVLAFLTEWHPKKAQKFRKDELQTWLDWMRRHDLVPTGTGPKTSTGRLFA